MQKNEIDNKYVFINQFVQKGKQCILFIKICRFFDLLKINHIEYMEKGVLFVLPLY